MTGAGAMEQPDEYRAALAELGSFVDLERRGMSAAPLGLARITELLERLDRPDRRYRSILIAGTKGKGSTAAMLERALRSVGLRTGLYSQPHLHTIRERIRVAGELIAPERFAEAFRAVQAVERGEHDQHATTAYEMMTAMALEAFAGAVVDVAVLEVGLGGRLDATNAVAADVSVLTSISLDHVEVLGPTVGAIATEKADIIKPGRPAVSAPQPADAMAVIRRVAAERGSPLRVACEDGARWIEDGGRWSLQTERGVLADVHPALAGAHQRLNAAVAATALEALASTTPIAVPLEALRVGIEQVEWPGRFEIVEGHPTIVLDGAHNVESAVRLREALGDQYGSQRRVLVLGIAADKDVAGIIAALADERATVVATRAGHPRAANAADIAELARAAGARTRVAETVAEALTIARCDAGADGLVVVTGSLYTVAEAREALGLAAHEPEPVFNPWATR